MTEGLNIYGIPVELIPDNLLPLVSDNYLPDFFEDLRFRNEYYNRLDKIANSLENKNYNYTLAQILQKDPNFVPHLEVMLEPSASDVRYKIGKIRVILDTTEDIDEGEKAKLLVIYNKFVKYIQYYLAIDTINRSNPWSYNNFRYSAYNDIKWKYLDYSNKYNEIEIYLNRMEWGLLRGSTTLTYEDIEPFGDAVVSSYIKRFNETTYNQNAKFKFMFSLPEKYQIASAADMKYMAMSRREHNMWLFSAPYIATPDERVKMMRDLSTRINPGVGDGVVHLFKNELKQLPTVTRLKFLELVAISRFDVKFNGSLEELSDVLFSASMKYSERVSIVMSRLKAKFITGDTNV